MFCFLHPSFTSRLRFFAFIPSPSSLSHFTPLKSFSVIFHSVKKWFPFVRCIFSCCLISLTFSITDLPLETFYGHNFSLNLSLREDYQCWSSIQILLTQRWNQNFRFMQILVMQFIFSLLMQQTQSINLAMQFLLGLLIIDILSI